MKKGNQLKKSFVFLYFEIFWSTKMWKMCDGKKKATKKNNSIKTIRQIGYTNNISKKSTKKKIQNKLKKFTKKVFYSKIGCYSMN